MMGFLRSRTATHIPRQARDGFSLLELVMGLSLIAFVVAVAAVGGSTVVERSQQRTAVLTLTTAKAEAQRVAARRDIQPGDERFEEFPATNQLSAAMRASGLTFTASASADADTVSVHVLDESTAMYAVKAGGRCLVLRHELGGTDGWATTQGSCLASSFAAVASWSVDSSAPTGLDEENT